MDPKGNLKRYLKNKKLGIVVCIVASIMLAGTIVAKTEAPKIWTKGYVLAALKKNQQVWGEAVFSQLRESEARSLAFDIRLKELRGEGLDSLNRDIKGMGITGTLKTDSEMEKTNAQIMINQENLKLATAKGYIDQTKVGFSIPEWYEGYLTLDTDHFFEAYRGSSWRQFSGIPLERETYDTLMKIWGNRERYGLMSQTVEQLGENTKSLVSGLDFKHTGTIKIEEEGQSQNCNTFEVVYKQDDIKKYIQETFTLLIENDEVETGKELFRTLEKLNQNEVLAHNIRLSKEKVKPSLEEIKQIKNFMSQLEKVELRTRLVINQKQEVVQIAHEARLINGAETIVIEADYALTKNYGQDYIAVDLHVTRGDGSQLDLRSKGTIEANNRDGDFTLDMKDIEMSIIHLEKEIALKLSGMYHIREMKEEEIVIPKDKERRLLDMSEEELTELEKLGYQRLKEIY